MGLNKTPSVVGGLIGGAGGAITGRLLRGTGGGSKSPGVPALSQQELDLLQNQGVTLDQFNSILQSSTKTAEANQGINQTLSGLYNPDGSVNQAAVQALQGKLQAQQGTNEQIGQNANQQLLNIFDQGQLGTLSDQAGVAEAQNYLNALNTQSSPTEAQKQDEAERFRKLSEAAGQRGIRIAGNDLFTASSDSTAGNQLLSQLRQEAQLSRETQRNNDLTRLQQANMQRLGFGLQRQGQTATLASSMQYDPSARPIGFAQNAQSVGPQSLLGHYQNLSSSLGAATQPYQQQRYLQFQGDLQNYANKQERKKAIGGLIGGVGGGIIGGMAGQPGLGFGIGSGIGSTTGGLF